MTTAVAETQPASPSAAQARIIAAATQLFARHGVGGTSLQMIADEIGVTKAAVYHQFKTKDEIVLAAAQDELARLRAVIETAEREANPKRARDAAINGIVERAIESRRTMSSIVTDPVIVGFFAHDKAFRDVTRRLRVLLVGDDNRLETRVQVAMLVAAISGAVMHPLVADVDDDTLRTQLRQLARRFLGLRA